jgi:hypothetical protein
LRKYIHTGEINLAFKKIYTHRGNNYCASEKLHLRTNESLHLGEINLAFEKVKFYNIYYKSYKSSSSIIFIITYFVAICSFLHVQ